MPIYEYRCGACGFQKEFLQRLNEKPLAVCPECGKRAFNKMVTAAGFQLKGTGWYATDFKGGSSAKTDKARTKKDKTSTKPEKPAAAEKSGESSGKDSSTSAPAAADASTN